tara:strand:- start:5334 stop:6794 length:1461 start_codon:yes stop_codon:yes gene_type:complete
MTSSNFKDKELAILREAVDKAEERSGKKIAQSEEVKQIMNIVENFLRLKKLVCYGGTAINNILPVQDQFYNKNIEIPDYDFYSANALSDAKELADIYNKAGYQEVTASAGVHHGTFKVFVNFIPVADITQLTPELFKAVKNQAIKVNGILYAPPDFLRMAMYLELSRPDGDVSRWEKVLKRLILLNKNYPITNERCKYDTFMRDFTNKSKSKDTENIFEIVKDSIIDQGLVFFGSYANSLYSRYMPKKLRKKFLRVPDFDVLSEDPETSAIIIKERLLDEGEKNITIIKKPGIGEVIAPHYEIIIGDESVCFIYKPLACHSYNTIKIGRNVVKIATIDTMLSFYLAFIYADRPYYDKDRIICMAKYLFLTQSKNRLEQKGLLKRFSINCYGHQTTLDEIRSEKTRKFKELSKNRNSKEYEEYFLRYIPGEKGKTPKKGKKHKRATNKRKKTKKIRIQNNKKTKTIKRIKVKKVKKRKSNKILNIEM